jgi:integrase
MSKIGYVKKLSDGKYLLRLSLGFDEFGKRRQPSRVVHADSDRQAEKALMDFWNDQKKVIAEVKKNDPRTLVELYDYWIENHVRMNLRKSTEVFYAGKWKKYLSPYGKAKLKVFSPRMVNDILRPLEKDSRNRAAVFGMLRTMFSKAVKWGFMPSNPCTAVDPPRHHPVEKKPYTDSEVLYILQCIQKEPLVYQAIFYFAVLCGLRRGEIIGLKWEDIDFGNGSFFVRRSVYNEKGVGTVPGNTKNYTSMRQLELPGTITPILRGIRAEQAERRLKLQNKWINQGWIFTRWNGLLMGQDRPDHWLAKMKKKYPKWPDKDFHTLRHTAITNMLLDGVPLPEVSKAAGHAQQSTTLNVYSHVIDRVRRRGIEASESHIERLKNKSVQ